MSITQIVGSEQVSVQVDLDTAVCAFKTKNVKKKFTSYNKLASANVLVVMIVFEWKRLILHRYEYSKLIS